MPDLSDVVQTLERLRDVIDVRSPLFTQRPTGIEVTQAVQYYRASEHLTDPGDRKKDNAALLVAYKPAVVRVYVAPSALVRTGDPTGGSLLLERRQGLFGPWRAIVTIAPWLLPTVTPIDDGYDDERSRFDRTLNFRIPAEQFFGSMRLTVTLDDGQTLSTTVSARLVQTLRVRAILVSYQGPSTANPPAGTMAPTVTLAAPTLADVQTTAALAFRMMPVQQTGSFMTAGTLAWTQPLDDVRSSPGACSTNWGALLTALGNIRTNDGNRADVVYYGILPSGIPLNVPGCGNDGLGAGAAGDTATFVHEIGHGYGFPHAPAGNAGTTDPDYPVYEPNMSGSIGEYGTDIQTGTVFTPATSTDYMSYGANRWMSLYHHAKLIEHDRLAPTWMPEPNPFDRTPVEFDPKHLWWPNPPWSREQIEKYATHRMIVMSGVIDEAGVVTVESVARVEANSALVGPPISWTAQLVGATGEIASRVALSRELQFGGEDCGCAPSPGDGDPDRLPLRFRALMPDTELGSALRIVDGRGEEAWVKKAPADPARFTRITAEVVEARAVRPRWDVVGEPASDVWAQVSTDGGRIWRGLAVGLTGGLADLDLTGLPAGEAHVRLLAHDGFSTAVSDAAAIQVPDLAPSPAILFPADGGSVPAGVDVEVHGNAVDQAGNPVDDELLSWEIDGEPFGRGRVGSLQVGPGEHVLTLRCETGPAADTSVRITALPLPRRTR
ncbi:MULTISPECIES: M66 family metalloprotease [unclassified Microbacterium]|uniref:M66 family metalloprotease n=1 Tax=unclassified Microbacterium TaxID=2609290 RepID=UPI00364C69BD